MIQFRMDSFTFLLKKFLTFFIEPFGLVVTLMVVGLYFLHKKRLHFAKIFLFGGFSLLLLFSFEPFSHFLLKNLEGRYPKYNYKTSVKYIHVLGGGHNTDPAQPLSSHLSDASTKRVLEGVIIHKRLPDTKLIFTGYEGSTSTPTAFMNAQLAIALGVDEKELLINPAPRDTKEEALFAKTIVKNEPFILVTSASHMPRAMLLFESLGMHPIPAPTDFHSNNTPDIIPSLGSFYRSQTAIHEYIGIVWAKIRS